MGDVWAPPRAQVQDPALGTADAVEMRRRYLNHEASVRSVGTLYYLAAAFLMLGAIAGVFSAVSSGERMGIVLSVALGALGALQFWIGRGLKALRSPARAVAGAISGIGALGFPIGTLINGYILYLLFSEKGKTVFSEEYRQVVAATPDIKYRTSLVVWIVLGLIILFFVVALAGPRLFGH